MQDRLTAFINHNLWLPVWAILGLFVRCFAIFKNGGQLNYFDERDYDEIARNILAGLGYMVRGHATAFRPPLQSTFLAMVYAAAGHSPPTAQLVQSLLLLPLTWIVYRFAKRLGATSSAPLVAAFVSVHPGLVISSASLYPVVLTTICLGAGIYYAVLSLDSPGFGKPIGAGILLGLAATASTYFVALPLLVSFLALRRKHWFMAAIVLILGLAPSGLWALRNRAALGAPVLATHGGYNLALGANDRATARSGNWIEPDPLDASLAQDELSKDKAYRNAAIRWIRSNPGRFALLAVGKAAAVLDTTTSPKTKNAQGSSLTLLVGGLLNLVVLFGLVGLWLRKSRVETLVVAAALGLVVASSAVSIAKPRFRFPVDPLLMVFAGLAAEDLAARLRRKKNTPSTAPEQE